MKHTLIILLGAYLMTAACSVKQTRTEPAEAEPANVEKSQDDQREKEAAEARKKKRKEQAEKELKKVVEQARPIIDNILEAIREDDHDRYIRDFNEAWKRAHSDKSTFLRINERRKERIGMPGRCQVLRIEKQPPYYIIYYLVKCSGVEEPITIRMVLAKENGSELKVAFLTYMSPALRD
jgi:flagellar biosynthesis GTPase FlhF